MKRKNFIATIATSSALIVFVALLLLGCGKTTPFDPCQVNPTRTTDTGEWVEADGEPIDSDPCDSDDFYENGKPKPVKPKVSIAPNKPANKPVPVRTRR